jgi:hypothetical protein
MKLRPKIDSAEVVLFGEKRTFRRLYRGHIARDDWTYTIPAICKLYRVCRNTVWNWVKNEGLQLIDGGSRPYAARGSELNRFHHQRCEDAKRPLREDELFCPGCDAPSKPLDDLIDIIETKKGAANIISRCHRCGKDTNRFVGPSQISPFQLKYRVNASPDRHD